MSPLKKCVASLVSAGRRAHGALLAPTRAHSRTGTGAGTRCTPRCLEDSALNWNHAVLAGTWDATPTPKPAASLVRAHTKQDDAPAHVRTRTRVTRVLREDFAIVRVVPPAEDSRASARARVSSGPTCNHWPMHARPLLCLQATSMAKRWTSVSRAQRPVGTLASAWNSHRARRGPTRHDASFSTSTKLQPQTYNRYLLPHAAHRPFAVEWGDELMSRACTC